MSARSVAPVRGRSRMDAGTVNNMLLHMGGVERAFCNTYIGTYANRKRVALQLHQQATIENLKISLDASSLIIADEINPHRFQERSSSRNTTEAMHMIPHAYNTFRKYSTETTKPSLVEDD
ncbi:predicted protein [Coccidioides posadasii str. Silveira]|uniref:Predicted protein n=1 Tax=Coccidioides posadasii (strain RMSCC 757 / Silveira) TaxID=443226 RepID=E9CXN3_COCPS|nr:predicted protein [Coccidioides posadasii str. Silveira]